MKPFIRIIKKEAAPRRVLSVISSQSYLCICLILSPIKAPLDVRPVCHYQLRFRSYLSGGERNMYVDRSRGWVERQRVNLTGTFPCELLEKKDGGLPQRGRGPLGTIGSPAIRGINMLDTSPARGNAFVTPGNILVPFSLSILYPFHSISFSLVFPSSSTLFFFTITELSFSPSFTFAPRKSAEVRNIQCTRVVSEYTVYYSESLIRRNGNCHIYKSCV